MRATDNAKENEVDEETTQTDENQVETNDTTNDTNNEETQAPDTEDVETSTEDADDGADIETATDPAKGTTTETTTAGDDDDEEEALINYQAPKVDVPPLDFSKLPTDESGNIDPQALVNAMAEHDQQLLAAATARSRNELMEMRQEELLWKRAEAKYPEMKGDKELRRLVQDTRYGIIASGKNASPLQAAERIFKHIGAAKQAGQTAAKTSVAIQQSAGLQSASTRNASAPTDDLVRTAKSGNTADAKAARLRLLEGMVESGAIPTRG